MARQHDSPEPHPEGGALNAAISQALVRLMADTTRRGPAKARTTVDRDYQEAMSADCVAAIEDLAGRRVIAFMSANRIDPDLAAEVFVLEPIVGNLIKPAPTVEGA
jgi:hypothetical protein